MPDFIPDSDTGFQAWVANFVTYANANLAALGLVAGDMTPITTAQTAFNTSLAANVTAQAAAQGARQQKDNDRHTLESAIRTLVQAKLAHSSAVSPAEAAALGLTVRDTTPTPVGPPAAAPVGDVDTSQRLRHIVNFRDPLSSAPRAKPAGVMGCEVWVKVGGPPPADPSECHYLATDTRTPYTAEFDGAEGGQMAHYMLRWVSTRHEPGPWSETVSATITG